MDQVSIQRMTRQRRVILEELQKLKTHPTVEELFERVQARLPHISLGTVYRNLDILSRCGMALKLDTAGSQCRFDGNPDHHYHVRCRECGAVGDLEAWPEGPSEYPSETPTGFKITGVHMEFLGLCPQCQDKV